MDRLLALIVVVLGLGLVATPWALHVSTHQATVVAIVAGGALVTALGLALMVQGMRSTPRHR